MIYFAKIAKLQITYFLSLKKFSENNKKLKIFVNLDMGFGLKPKFYECECMHIILLNK